MAVQIVGVGILGTVSGNTITFSRGINGDGLFVFTTSHFILDITATLSKAITSITTDPSDFNKITAISVADATGFSSGDRFALKDTSSTTTFANFAAANTGASNGDVIIMFPLTTGEDREFITSSSFSIDNTITLETDTLPIPAISAPVIS